MRTFSSIIAFKQESVTKCGVKRQYSRVIHQIRVGYQGRSSSQAGVDSCQRFWIDSMLIVARIQ